MNEDEETREMDVIGEPENSKAGAPTPGTIVLRSKEEGTEQAKVYKTSLISASSKAKARIRTCEECGKDNRSETKFCVKCGADLLEQDQRKATEAAQKQIEEYKNKVAKPAPKRDGKTILRRRRAPIMRVQGDVEKKSYHSHYIPPVVPDGQFDPSASMSTGNAVAQQPPQVPQQYVSIPVSYAGQGEAKEKQTSFIIGVVVVSVLSVLFVALMVTIVVLLLK